MHTQRYLGLVEIRSALQAMLDTAPQKTRHPLAMAIVDNTGDLMIFARMDGATPFALGYSVRKAYTATRMRSDVRDFTDSLKAQGRRVRDFADPGLVASRGGGVVVFSASDGAVLGGIGVSGGTPEEDDEVARAGLAVLQR